MNNKTPIIGRERELSKLDNIIASDHPEFLVVYGRRRVGKTFLIRHHLEKNMVFDFTGSFAATLQRQLDNFYNQYVRWTSNKKALPPKSWTQAFDLLTDYLISLNRRKRIVVFIDELPWLDTRRSGFLSALEYFWNQHGSQMTNLLLVGCGSAASWIRKKLLKAKGGLYNRVTQRIHLQPFSLKETEQYLVSRRLKFTKYQILQLYMSLGGIPFYLKDVPANSSVDQVLDQLCFTPGGLLADEYKQLYYSLFKNADDHISIVEGLASKPNGVTRSDILKISGLPDGGTFTRALSELIDCGFVMSYKPHRKKKKDTVYRLIDLYSLFYLKYIQFNVSKRRNTWQSLKSASGYNSWSGYAYENIALLHIDQIHHELGIDGMHTDVSSWRHSGNDEVPGSQIDLIIDRPDDIIHLCEVKFTNKEYLLDKEYSKKLRQRMSIFQHLTSTKKLVLNTLITTYPAIHNQYYREEIDSEVTMEELFKI